MSKQFEISSSYAMLSERMERNTSHHLNPITKTIAKIKENIRFKKIKKALMEVEQIEAGILKPITFEQLLNEL